MQTRATDPGDVSSIRRPLFRWMIMVLSTVLTFVTRAQDVSTYLVAKGQNFHQAGPELSSLLTNDQPFVFVAFVESAAPGSVSSARVQLPDGLIKMLTNGFGELQMEERFATKRALDTAFETGPYTFLIEGVHDGTRASSVNLRSSPYPSIPHIANWEAAQDIDAAADFTLTWDRFARGTSNDYVYLAIANEQGEKVFESPGFIELEALDGAAVSLTIPTGVFRPSQLYHARLLFVKRAGLNLTGYPGATGVSGYYRETSFNLVSAPPSPAQGRLQFDASAYTVDERSGTATIRVIRTGGSAGQVSVDFTTLNDYAAAGFDYMPRNGTLIFYDGQTSQAFDVPLWDDWTLEGNERLWLMLSNPTGGSILGTPSHSVLTLIDNEIRGRGMLQFSRPRYVVSETNRVAIIDILRVGGAAGNVTVDFSTSDGTASDGWDYRSRLRVVNFAPGQTSRTVTVPIINDTIDESNQTVLLYLSNPGGGACLGLQNTAQLVIKDNDAGGVLNFRTASFSVTETNAFATIVVIRTRGLASGVTVDYSTADGTATSGFDYMGVSGTLTFDAGVARQSFIVPLLDDDLPEGDETISLMLSNPTGGARLGALTNAVLNVLDGELTLQFSRESYRVSETGKVASIVVVRSGPTNDAVFVDYTTGDATAMAPADYLTRSGTLTVPAGARRAAFTIPIVNDMIAEGEETLNLALANPVGAFLGPRINAVLTIADNDQGGVINFRFAGYSTNETAPQAIIAVTRTGGAAGEVTVNFSTADDTALAGTHYVATSGTLSFGYGEVLKTFNVPLLNNGWDEPDKTVLLRLTNPGGGAELGALTNAVLTIVDDDAGVPSASESSSRSP